MSNYTSKAKPLIIVGAGAHGRVVLDAATESGLRVSGFIDTVANRGVEINGFPVLGDNTLLNDVECLEAHAFIVAIGDQQARRELSCRLLERGSLATVVHPSAMVSSCAAVGVGTIIVAGAIVNPNAKIGRFCILNTGCTVDHDNTLADGVQICPGAHLAGGVRCGADAFIGTGAIIVPNISIGNSAIVGAGCVVIRDVPDHATVVGNPARII